MVSPHAANATNRAEKNKYYHRRKKGVRKEGEKKILPPLTMSFILLLLFSSVVHWAAGFSSSFISLTLFIGGSYLISYKISRLPIALKFGNGSGGLISAWKGNVLFHDGGQLACSTLLCSAPLCSPEQMGSE